MKKIIKTLSILSVVALMLLACGCGKEETESVPDTDELLATQYDNMVTAVSGGDSESVIGYIEDWAEINNIEVAYSGDAAIVLYTPARGKSQTDTVAVHCAIDMTDIETGAEQAAILLYNAAADTERGELYTIITVVKKKGNTGAYEVPEEYLSADRFLSLNHVEKKPVVFTTSAGIKEYTLSRSVKYSSPQYTNAYRIRISGLEEGNAYGFSSGYPNPVTRLADILSSVTAKGHGIEIASFSGGKYVTRNATSAEAVVLVSDTYCSGFEKVLDKNIEKYLDKNQGDNPSLIYTYEKLEKTPSKVLDYEDASRLLSLIYTRLDKDYFLDDDDNLIAYSDISAVNTGKSEITVRIMNRSISGEKQKEMNGSLKMIAQLSDFRTKCDRTVATWSCNTDEGSAYAYITGLGSKLNEDDTLAVNDLVIFESRCKMNSCLLGSNFNNWVETSGLVAGFCKTENTEEE